MTDHIRNTPLFTPKPINLTDAQITGIVMSICAILNLLTFISSIVVASIYQKLLIREKWLNRLILCCISISVGVFFGDAIFNLIPTIFAEYVSESRIHIMLCSVILIAGYLTYYLIDKITRLVRRRYKNNKHKYEVVDTEKSNTAKDKIYPIYYIKHIKAHGTITLITGLIDSFFEGMIIGLIFSTKDVTKIIPTTIAVTLGIVPIKIGDCSILLMSGLDYWHSVFWNTIVNIPNFAGAGIGLSLGYLDYTGHAYTMSYISGNFLYISLTEMMPIKVGYTGVLNVVLQLILFLLGLSIMFVIVLIEYKFHEQ